MTLTENIKKLSIDALKAKDDVRLRTFRMLSTSLHNAKIDKMSDLNDEEELDILQKEIKKRKESIEAYKLAKREDRVNAEIEEMNVLMEFMPEQLSDEEIEKLIDEAIEKAGAKVVQDMGRVMGMIIPLIKGKADASEVSLKIKEKLS